MFGGFNNQTDYFNYHFNQIKRNEYLSNKYEISKIDKEFLETIKKWLFRHISKC